MQRLLIHRISPTQSVDVELKITAPSNINFGNTQSSAFVVDPSIRTNVATNITSNATLTDEITFTIQTDSSWNWGWTMDDVDGTNAYTTGAEHHGLRSNLG